MFKVKRRRKPSARIPIDYDFLGVLLKRNVGHSSHLEGSKNWLNCWMQLR